MRDNPSRRWHMTDANVTLTSETARVLFAAARLAGDAPVCIRVHRDGTFHTATATPNVVLWATRTLDDYPRSSLSARIEKAVTVYLPGPVLRHARQIGFLGPGAQLSVCPASVSFTSTATKSVLLVYAAQPSTAERFTAIRRQVNGYAASPSDGGWTAPTVLTVTASALTITAAVFPGGEPVRVRTDPDADPGRAPHLFTDQTGTTRLVAIP